MAKRGRPKGSTYPDGPYLDQIADALTRNSAKSANAAIMKIAKSEGIPQQGLEAFRRRLHDKWSAQKKERMAKARERRAEHNRSAEPVVRRNRSTLEVLRSIEQSPAMKVACMHENWPNVRLQTLYYDHPQVRSQKILKDMSAATRLQRMLYKLNV